MKPPPPRKYGNYWRVDYYEGNKRRSKYFGNVNKVSARQAVRAYQDWWADYISDMMAGTNHLEYKGDLRKCVAKFMDHASRYYRMKARDGTYKKTSTYGKFNRILNKLIDFAGDRDLGSLRPSDWKALRNKMIEGDMSRQGINDYMSHYRHFVAWCVEEEIAQPEALVNIQVVKALKAGRSMARESEGVTSVDLTTVKKTCKHLPQTIQDMIWVQYWGAMRPGEVCSMRWTEIDRSQTPWIYTPAHHKNSHHGKSRRIFLGPQAREILQSYVSLNLNDAIFSPQRAVAERAASAPSHRRPNQTPNPRETARRVGKEYNSTAYSRAINRACKDAKVVNWTPNQLRHTAEQRIEMTVMQRGEHGIGAARAVLGHSKIETTHHYRDTIDSEIAAKWAEELG